MKTHFWSEPVIRHPRSFVGLVPALLLSVGCVPSDSSHTSTGDAGARSLEAAVAAQQEWKVDRLSKLRAEEGWLAVVGLYWLQDGEQTVGWGDEATIQLPEAPTDAPAVLVRMRLSLAPGEPPSAGEPEVEISITDERASVSNSIASENSSVDPSATWQTFLGSSGEAPPTLVFGSFEMFAIERGDQFALRVRNRQSPARSNLVEIPTFPVDQDWVITGRFEEAEEIRELAIDNSTDFDYPQRSIGRFVFERDGQAFSMELLGTDPAESQLLMVGDTSSGDVTYGGGRYLYVEVEPSGDMRADFNRLYNPPCVFTAFATCPLPPASNRLPFTVEAGEKVPRFAEQAH